MCEKSIRFELSLCVKDTFLDLFIENNLTVNNFRQ